MGCRSECLLHAPPDRSGCAQSQGAQVPRVAPLAGGQYSREPSRERRSFDRICGCRSAARHGLHRYVFLVFKQPQKLTCNEPKIPKTSGDKRANFSTSKFMSKYKLGDPIAGNFFRHSGTTMCPSYTSNYLARSSIFLLIIRLPNPYKACCKEKESCKNR